MTDALFFVQAVAVKFWKTVSIAIYLFFAYFGISHNLMELFSWLVVFDMICGITASHTLGNRFTIGKFVGGFLAKMILIILPLSLAATGKILVEVATGNGAADMTALVGIAFAVLALSQLYSIIQNLRVIILKKEVESHDILAPVLSFLSKYVQSIAEKIIDQKGVDETSNRK